MRLSLSADVTADYCGVCKLAWSRVINIALVTDTHVGDTGKICEKCLFGQQSWRIEIPTRPLVEGPAPRRKALRKNKRLSQKQEVELAEELGWRTQPGSGNQRGAKGDARRKDVGRLEAKLTQADSFSLKLEELEKIEGECTGFEKPVLVIDFLEPGTRSLRGRYAVFRFADAKELLHVAGQHR